MRIVADLSGIQQGMAALEEQLESLAVTIERLSLDGVEVRLSITFDPETIARRSLRIEGGEGHAEAAAE